MQDPVLKGCVAEWCAGERGQLGEEIVECGFEREWLAVCGHGPVEWGEHGGMVEVVSLGERRVGGFGENVEDGVVG